MTWVDKVNNQFKTTSVNNAQAYQDDEIYETASLTYMTKILNSYKNSK